MPSIERRNALLALLLEIRRQPLAFQISDEHAQRDADAALIDCIYDAHVSIAHERIDRWCA
jgi:hypothetical protein